MYGTTYGVGDTLASDTSTLFKCTTSGVLTTLHRFPRAEIMGGLILASDSNLYGLSQMDGTFGFGTLFKSTLNGTLTTMVNFSGPNGQFPWGTLMEASDSNLYGTTTVGGAYGGGTVFQYKLSGTLTSIISFNGSSTGAYPERQSLVEIIKKDTGTGINKLTTANEELRVYPNPFTNTTTIALSTAGNYYLEIDDLTGRKLKYIEFTGNEYILSAEGLAKGMYFVRISDINNSVIGTTKIVVQ